MNAEDLLNADDEVVVALKDGHALRSGTYAKSANDLVSGEYVRLCAPDGTEILYWDQAEWAEDPARVMGAIMNSAAGLRLVPNEGLFVPEEEPAAEGEPAPTFLDAARVEAFRAYAAAARAEVNSEALPSRVLLLTDAVEELIAAMGH